MARKKTIEIDATSAEGQKQFDEMNNFLMTNTRADITSLKDGGQIQFWIDTGSYALNWIIGNNFFQGIPGCRIIIISGDTGKGKSLLTDVMLGANVRMGGVSYKVAIESAANYDFSSQIVGSEEVAAKIQIIKPNEGEVITIENLMAILNRAIDFQTSKKTKKNNSVLFVIDSVTQLSSEKELDNVKKIVAGKDEKKDMTSPVKMRETLRTIEQKLEHANITVVGIGQLTANIPTGWVPVGTPKTVVNVKGSGFLYASSLSINMISDKEIVHPKTGIPIGIKMRMKTTKNRIKYKGRDCWIHFYFSKGIDRFGGLPELLARYGAIEAFELIEVVDKKTGEPKLDESGQPIVKRKPIAQSSTGEFSKPPTCSFIRPDGTEVLFKRSTMKKVIEENGGDVLLQEMNDKINKIYQSILDDEGITDADMLESDSTDDSEGEQADE